MDLRGGSVEWASKDKSSKKHVIEVGTELKLRGVVSDIMVHLHTPFYDLSSLTPKD